MITEGLKKDYGKIINEERVEVGWKIGRRWMKDGWRTDGCMEKWIKR